MLGVCLDSGDAVPSPEHEPLCIGDAAKPCVCNQHAGDLAVPWLCALQASGGPCDADPADPSAVRMR
jgi:hypothetical protein